MTFGLRRAKILQLVSKIFNLCGHDLPTSQTVGQTTCDLKTALCICTIVHRAVKREKKTKMTKPSSYLSADEVNATTAVHLDNEETYCFAALDDFHGG